MKSIVKRAVTQPVDTTKTEEFKFVSFKIDNELLGVDILDVKEVTSVMEITPIHHAPEEVMGYVNIRGEIHLVINLRYLLGYATSEKKTDSKIIIFKTSIAEPFGIYVDTIGEVIEVEESYIEPYNKSNHSQGKEDRLLKLVRGVCKLEEQLLVVLDSKKLLRTQG